MTDRRRGDSEMPMTDTEMLDWLEKQLLNKDGSWRVMGRHLLIENGERKNVHLHRGDGQRDMRRVGTGTSLRGAILNANQTAAARSLTESGTASTGRASQEEDAR